MNPIDFCRLTGYHSTIFLTFSFDALFFERIVLSALRASGNGTVLVVTDFDELSDSQGAWSGQLVQLGRRYQVFACDSSGAFHPKMIVRIGKRGGAVWIGSANLTFAGWSVNRELGTAWTFGAGRLHGGGWFIQLLSLLKQQGATESQLICLDRIARESWVSDLDEHPAEDSATLLTTFGGTPLATQLVERWRGRSFSSVRVMTGSTDARGAFLRHLHREFGVTESDILVDRGRCSFQSTELRDLPLEVVVSAPETELSNPLHAKFYWFEGSDGPAAVFGSANCSAAAWLIDASSNGNHEAVVVYDQPNPDDFREVLKLFEAERASIDLSEEKPNWESDVKGYGCPIRILSAGWHDASHPLVVYFDSDPGKRAEVVVRLGNASYVLSASDADRKKWLAAIPDSWAEIYTPFAEVQISGCGTKSWKLSVWIDNYSELRLGAQRDGLDEPFRNMARAKTTTEQRNILKSLQHVASAILADADLHDDPQDWSPHKERESKSSSDVEPVAIDPSDLIKSIAEVSDKLVMPEHNSQHSGFHLSPMGVMRALYDVDSRNSPDPLQGETNDDQQGKDGVRPGHTEKSRVNNRSADLLAQQSDEDEINEKFKERLRVQTADYIEKLGSTEFAERVSATQLVQAAAYPLAVAVISVRDRWASSETASEWCRQTFEVLFRRQYSGKCNGLIPHVAERYRQRGEFHTFKAIVGDGSLWFALLSAMYHFSWEGHAGPIERAFVIREIFRCRALFEAAHPGRLRVLMNRDTQLRLIDVLKEAPKIDNDLQMLERNLEINFQRIVATQTGTEAEFKATDLMWNPKAGWAIYTEGRPAGEQYLSLYLYARGAVRSVGKGFFVNVSMAAATDKSMRANISALSYHR